MTRVARLVAVVAVLGVALGPLAHPLAAQAPAPPPPPATSNAPIAASPTPGATAAAVAINIFRIPGKTLLCGIGTLAAGTLMVLTFGSQYRGAGAVFREGCGGKWVIDENDLDRNVDAPKAIFSGEAS